MHVHIGYHYISITDHLPNIKFVRSINAIAETECTYQLLVNVLPAERVLRNVEKKHQENPVKKKEKN